MAILVAHRGFRSPNGENRMIDFKNALKICKGVEFDIRLTKDNQVIIFHDDTFERIGNDKRNVNDLTLFEIEKLPFFKNNLEWLPPLFSDFVKNLSKDYQMINVEIKEEVNRKYTNDELDIIFDEIASLSNYTNAEIIVSSFNHDILDAINQRIKLPMKKAYLFETKQDFLDKYALSTDYIHPWINGALDNEMINKLKTIGKPLNIWTFKTTEQAEKINKIYGNQIFSYISDNPEINWS